MNIVGNWKDAISYRVYVECKEDVLVTKLWFSKSNPLWFGSDCSYDTENYLNFSIAMLKIIIGPSSDLVILLKSMIFTANFFYVSL